MSARSGHFARTVVMVLTTGALQAPSAAAAPPSLSAEDARSAADDLFQQGRIFLEAKDYIDAAAKFAESLRLYPGGGTQLNLALAYERAGKTATARAAFGEALRMAVRDQRPDRVLEAQTHIGSLEGRLSRLRIVVPESVRGAGLELRCDGVTLGETSWNVDIPVDPGEHRVEATGPDRKPWNAIVTVGGDADRQEVIVGVLADERRPLEAPHPLPPTAPAPESAHASSDVAARGTAGHRVAGSVALAAAGVLAGLGVVAWRIRENNVAIYDDDNRCLVDARTRAEQCGGHSRAADVALGVEIGAFAAAGLGGVLGAWLLSRSSAASLPVAGATCVPSAALGILCRGTF